MKYLRSASVGAICKKVQGLNVEVDGGGKVVGL